MFLIGYVAVVGRDALVGPATSYIAGELRAQKARLGWTLDEIEIRSGVPRTTVDRAMKGKTALAVEVLLPLCLAMGLDAASLVAAAQESSDTQ